ncbi:hypothetical protein SLE2022_396040 [Rubroshorea leprosula]
MMFTLDKEHDVKNSCEKTGYKANHRMPRAQSNCPTQTNNLSLSTSLLEPCKQIMHKSFTIATKVPEEMAAQVEYPLVEIGTTGTVASLIMQEIEYFRRLELSHRASSKKPHCNTRDTASSSSHCRPTIRSAVASQKKKKRGGSKLLPSICSMVEIAENRPVGVSGFGYRSLKSDEKKL